MLSNTLPDLGFRINDFDWYVTNKTINGRQYTIIWHVDDLNISHEEWAVVKEILKKLTDKFGKDSPITNFHWLQWERRCKNFPCNIRLKITRSGPTGHGWDSENTCSQPPIQRKWWGSKSHHSKIVAKLLYLCRRTCQYLQTVVIFLWTRVKSSDEGDYKKQTSKIQYIRDTQDITLNTECRWQPTVVGRMLECFVPRHEEPHWHIHVHLKRVCTYLASYRLEAEARDQKILFLIV